MKVQQNKPPRKVKEDNKQPQKATKQLQDNRPSTLAQRKLIRQLSRNMASVQRTREQVDRNAVNGNKEVQVLQTSHVYESKGGGLKLFNLKKQHYLIGRGAFIQVDESKSTNKRLLAKIPKGYLKLGDTPQNELDTEYDAKLAEGKGYVIGYIKVENTDYIKGGVTALSQSEKLYKKYLNTLKEVDVLLGLLDSASNKGHALVTAFSKALGLVPKLGTVLSTLAEKGIKTDQSKKQKGLNRTFGKKDDTPLLISKIKEKLTPENIGRMALKELVPGYKLVEKSDDILSTLVQQYKDAKSPAQYLERIRYADNMESVILNLEMGIRHLHGEKQSGAQTVDFNPNMVEALLDVVSGLKVKNHRVQKNLQAKLDKLLGTAQETAIQETEVVPNYTYPEIAEDIGIETRERSSISMGQIAEETIL